MTNNWIVVSDNGRGIPVEQFKAVLYPYHTKKRRNSSRTYRRTLKGSQGIGLKASIFSSELFELDTVHNGRRWTFSRNGMYKFDQAGFDSTFSSSDPTPTKAHNGTTIKLRLHKVTVKDFLSERVEEWATRLQLLLSPGHDQYVYGNQQFTPKIERILGHYLRTQTYAGDLTRTIGFTPALPEIHLDFRIEADTPVRIPGVAEFTRVSGTTSVGYFSAREAYNTSFDSRQRATIPFIDQPWHEVVERDRRLEGSIYETHIFGDEIQKLLGSFEKSASGSASPFRFVPPDRERLRPFSSALARINGIKIVIAKAETLRWRLGIPTEQVVSVNGLVTDIPLVLGRAGYTGYRTSTHVVIDIDATLGIGKRNLGGDLVLPGGRTRDALNRFYTAIWNNIARVAQLITKEPDEGVTRITNDYNEADLEVGLSPPDQVRMLELFGRLTTPVSELDVLQAHQYLVR